MAKYYTNERNVQMLISLMKHHGIRKVVASPGATNVTFVGSIQQDPFFEIYSSVDERSAAYIACGLAAESGEPVALSCTGATASRNYPSGLTEAYYRQLPVLAITATQYMGRIGHYVPQVIDRSVQMKDIVKLSVQIPTINTPEDEWATACLLNKAILELRHRGCGPVHINLATNYSPDFSVQELPPVKLIDRICHGDSLPEIPQGARIGVFAGAHRHWSDDLTECVDSFCAKYNGVVLCDHTSNYHGKYRIFASLLLTQQCYRTPLANLDILIHIGNVSGSCIYPSAKAVWRVNPDGEIRDTFKKLRYVFEMNEMAFFKAYCSGYERNRDGAVGGFYDQWMNEVNKVSNKVPELPFSNPWLAKHSVAKIPAGSVLHLGILNTLRSWNFFDLPNNGIDVYCNTGGFGIDGMLSTVLGASLADSDRLYFCVIGDLGFFYDMNALGNRHLGKNVRLMVINNGRGTEFRNFNHPAERFGDDADRYMAAAGHFGNQSPDLLRHYATDLGCEYISAATKDEYLDKSARFFTNDNLDRPVVFEVFTNSMDESDALKMLYSIESSMKGETKKIAKGILGDKGIKAVKKLLHKE